MKADVAVIGGGMVGSAIAYGLLTQNLSVLVLDGGDRDFRAANANFGLVWQQGKGMDMPAYQGLTRNALDLWPAFCEALTDTSAIDLQYERKGGLAFCLSEEDFEQRRVNLLRLHNQLGGAEPEWEMLDRAALAKLLPKVQLGPEVAGASLGFRDGHVNPLRLLAALQAAIVRKGGVLQGGSLVHTIRPDVGGGFTLEFGSERASVGNVVIAAGLGTQALGAQVGLDIPLRAQRGQILVTERLEPFLPLPASGLRQTREGTVMIGATQEDVGLDTSTTTAAAAALSVQAIRRVPALSQVKLVRQWAGLRILTPDWHPVYAESESHPGAFVATCHSASPWRPRTRRFSPKPSWRVGFRLPSTHSTTGDLMFRKLHEPTSGGITITIDGAPAAAEAGESVAAVLLRQEEAWSRLTPATLSRRAPYCMMGVCFDCLAEVDGVASVQTCLKPASDGMRVVRQTGKRRIAPLTA